jgi:hypothetical protein
MRLARNVLDAPAPQTIRMVVMDRLLAFPAVQRIDVLRPPSSN